MKKERRGLSTVLATVLVLVMTVFLVVILFVFVNSFFGAKTNEADQQFFAIGHIQLKVSDVYFNESNLYIVVENMGTQDITGFMVKVKATNGSEYINNSVYLANKEKLGPANTKSIIIIPAPFGTNKTDYESVEVTPKFEYNGKEAIAESGKVSVQASKIGNVGGSKDIVSAPTPIPVTNCSDGIDNDGDGYIDMNDSGCLSPASNSEGNGNDLCRDDFSQIDGNLVLNPYIECGHNGVPDNWTKIAEDVSTGHILSWVNTSASNNVLLSKYNGTVTNANAFDWYQNIPVKPNTWYNFSFDYSTEGVEIYLKTEYATTIGYVNRSLLDPSVYMGVTASCYDSSNKMLYCDGGIQVKGPSFTDWDNSVGMYRSYAISGEPWTHVQKYFKTMSNTTYISIHTYNYPRGKIYVDNIMLKEVSDQYPFVKSGTLKFAQYKGGDFFPIIFDGIPKNGSIGGIAQHLDLNYTLDLTKVNGFNVVNPNYYSNAYSLESIKQSFVSRDLAVVTASHVPILSNTEIPGYRGYMPWEQWYNDSEHKIDYIGLNMAKGEIDNWINFQNTFAIGPGADEEDGNPYGRGASIGQIRQLETPKEYIKSINPNMNIITEYNGKLTNQGPYTGLISDMKTYTKYEDMLTFTLNSFNEVPYNVTGSSNYGTSDPDDVGLTVRRFQDQGFNKTFLAYGLVYIYWTGKTIYPYNLQRFQIWDQIINGATGVWFWGTYSIDVKDSNLNREMNVIFAMSKELSFLKPVLMQPEFYDEWSVSDPRVEIMMKKYNGEIYLFTTSNTYVNLNNVRIALDSKYHITQITSLNDVSNGDFAHQFNRTIPINPDGYSFNDNFTGENASSPQGYAEAGYATHIYKIDI